MIERRGAAGRAAHGWMPPRVAYVGAQHVLCNVCANDGFPVGIFDVQHLASAHLEKSFERSYASLSELFRFLDTYLESWDVGEADAFSAQLALEELFTNMVKYSTSGVDRITVRLGIEDGELSLALEDHDAEPFDPRAHPAPDLSRPLAERRPGGLGLHLVRNMMDSIDHRYADRRNVVTLRKKLSK